MKTTRTQAVLAVALILLAGCASTKLKTVQNNSDPTRGKPDIVVVHDFAVSPDKVELDKSLLGKIGSNGSGASADVEAQAVGLLVADALAQKLVAELNDEGIKAYRAKDAPRTTAQSASISGYFESVDQGNRSKRVMIGFGLGGSEVRTHFYFYRGVGVTDAPVAEMMTVAKSSLKPGMAAAAGVGVVRGTAGAAVAVSGATSAASEKFSDSVEADARRSAKEVADQIIKRYRANGWL